MACFWTAAACSPDKRQLRHPADDAWHLFGAEQEAAKEDGEQHC